jgi:hypothetical protein
MIQGKKAFIASLVVGAAGAAIGGLGGFIIGVRIGSSGSISVTLPTGVLSGFLSSFLVSMWYLKFMTNKNWQRREIFGLFFGALVGASCAIVTTLADVLFASINGCGEYRMTDIILALAIWTVSGVIVGAVIGSLFSFILGAFFTKAGKEEKRAEISTTNRKI